MPRTRMKRVDPLRNSNLPKGVKEVQKMISSGLGRVLCHLKGLDASKFNHFNPCEERARQLVEDKADDAVSTGSDVVMDDSRPQR